MAILRRVDEICTLARPRCVAVELRLCRADRQMQEALAFTSSVSTTTLALHAYLSQVRPLERWAGACP